MVDIPAAGATLLLALRKLIIRAPEVPAMQANIVIIFDIE
jgi:hypothetical protein